MRTKQKRKVFNIWQKTKRPSGPNKNDKKLKPRFNTNWFFFVLLLAFIAIQVLFSGKYTKKASQKDIEEMIINHDIEKVVVVNKEQAEIYIKPEKLKEKRYSDFARAEGFRDTASEASILSQFWHC